MNQLEKTLLEANEKRFREAKNPLRSHGPDHHWRTYQNALKLADKLGVEYDAQVLAGAALLHDMAAYYPEQTGDDYHDFDHKLAGEVLREIDFPAGKIKDVQECIANHGTDPKFKRSDERIEITLLRDGDKLEAFGPIGVARILMARSLRGNTLDEIVDDFLTHGHLEGKWNAISTDAAREMGRADYEYSRDFFSRLAESLKPAV